jgi:peptidoglycan/LPS O-acetylase OafA/YrhL
MFLLHWPLFCWLVVCGRHQEVFPVYGTAFVLAAVALKLVDQPMHRLLIGWFAPSEASVPAE